MYPLVPITEKSTKILILGTFLDLSGKRISKSYYKYKIIGFNGIITTNTSYGIASLESGETYTIDMEYVGDKVVPIKDVHLLLALIKASTKL